MILHRLLFIIATFSLSSFSDLYGRLRGGGEFERPSVPIRSRIERPQELRTPTRNDVDAFLKNQPIKRTIDQPLRTHPYSAQNREEIGRNTRENIGRNQPNRNNWFNENFWKGHGYTPPYFRRGEDGWKWASAAGIGAWLGWRHSPYYYDYYGDNGTSYWGPPPDNGTPPPPQNDTQTTPPPSDATTSSEWMPLGVFAVTRGEKTTPNMYLQLALNKDGMLSGTFYDTQSNQTFVAEGQVDQKTQMAAWKVVDTADSPVFATGLYNLTKSETPVQVHFTNGKILEMVLVHIKKQTSN